MKNMTLTAALVLSSLSAFAGNFAVERAAAEMKESDTRTVIKDVENKDGNPCLPEGKSYQVELQVKQAAYDRLNNRVVYSWETVKTINVDKLGSVSEVCAE